MSDSLWATVWQTVAAEFSDVPDLSEGLRILLRLSLAFDTSAESWLAQQLQFDLWQAEKRRPALRVKRLSAA